MPPKNLKMLTRINQWIFKQLGWTVDTQVPSELTRCVVIAAPHTSNWDFYYTLTAFSIFGMKIRFTIKREWMKFPFGIITKPLGGIAIDRRTNSQTGERKSYVEAMAELFSTQKKLVLVITPEGTRSKRTEWKTGFYHIATTAKVPICLGYVDYKAKKAGIGKTLYPTNFEADMKEIMNFYQGISGKFPENFSVDTRYV